jgi:hypothetical protein
MGYQARSFPDVLTSRHAEHSEVLPGPQVTARCRP